LHLILFFVPLGFLIAIHEVFTINTRLLRCFMLKVVIIKSSFLAFHRGISIENKILSARTTMLRTFTG